MQCADQREEPARGIEIDGDLVLQALDLTRRLPFDVEYWPIPNPTAVEGSREQRLDAYRAVRDDLLKRLKARFAWRPAGSV